MNIINYQIIENMIELGITIGNTFNNRSVKCQIDVLEVF
jgi:hypothetical protein